MGLLDGFSDIVIRIAGDTSGLAASLEETKGQLKELEISAKDLLAIGATFTAIGAAVVKLTDDAKKMNAELGMTALNLGVTTEEMRELAIETANAGFPLQEVQKTFDLLARSGVETTEDLKSIAEAMDMLGDATGNSADATTAIMIPALKAFDIPLQDVGKHSDALTYMVRNSTIGLDDFSATMNRLAPDLQGLGLSIDDVVSILMALENKGIRGRAALTEFSEGFKAIDDAYKSVGETSKDYQDAIDKLAEEKKKLSIITREYKDDIADAGANTERQARLTRDYNQAVGDQKSKITEAQAEVDALAASQGKAVNPLQEFYGALKVSEYELSNYDTLAGDVVGTTERYAAVADSSIGTMDQLKSMFDELSLSAGSVLEPLSGAAGAMAAFGPVIGAIGGLSELSSILGGLGGAAGGAGGILGGLTGGAGIAGIGATLLPLLPIIAAVAAGIAVLYVAWTQDWGGIQEKTASTVEWLKGAFEDLVEALSSFYNAVRDILARVLDIVDDIVDSIAYFIEWVGKFWEALTSGDTAAVKRLLGELLTNFVAGLAEIFGKVQSLSSDITRSLVEGFNALVIAAAKAGWDLILALVNGIIENLFSISQATINIVKVFNELLGELPSMASRWGGEIINQLVAGIAAYIYSITSEAYSIVNEFENTLGNLPSMAYSWGSNLLSSFTSGIWSQFSGLTDAVWSAANEVSSYLGINSPAETGPLRTVTEWGGNLVETIADGITDNRDTWVNAIGSLAYMPSIPTTLPGIAVAQTATYSPPPSSSPNVIQLAINFTGDVYAQTADQIEDIGEGLAEVLNRALANKVVPW